MFGRGAAVEGMGNHDLKSQGKWSNITELKPLTQQIQKDIAKIDKM